MEGIKEIHRTVAVQPVPVPPGTEWDVSAWLLENAPPGAAWLLAHSYTGVVWGRVERGQLVLQENAHLQSGSLLQARLFGPDGELFLWRDRQGWQARLALVDQAQGQPYDGWQEDQWLWGSQGKPAAKGFTLLNDGAQGLWQSVPLAVPEAHFRAKTPNYRPVRLRVEHYLRQVAETGLAEVWLSRLSDLSSQAAKETEVQP